MTIEKKYFKLQYLPILRFHLIFDQITGTQTVRCCLWLCEGCDWVWDEECRSSSVSLSRCKRTVSFHSEYSCGTAGIRGAKPLADGQHFWEIKMTSPVYGTDMVR